MQDAFVTYLEKAPADLENPAAWLMRVLVNGCKSRLRLSWRQVVELPETLPAPEPREREELEELWQLPPEERCAIHLRSRLSRARERLRALLGDRKE